MDPLAERLDILRALVALPPRCHDVVDLVMEGPAEQLVRERIRELLGCGDVAAEHVSQLFRAISPAVQESYRIELSERGG